MKKIIMILILGMIGLCTLTSCNDVKGYLESLYNEADNFFNGGSKTSASSSSNIPVPSFSSSSSSNSSSSSSSSSSSNIIIPTISTTETIGLIGAMEVLEDSASKESI